MKQAGELQFSHRFQVKSDKQPRETTSNRRSAHSAGVFPGYRRGTPYLEILEGIQTKLNFPPLRPLFGLIPFPPIWAMLPHRLANSPHVSLTSTYTGDVSRTLMELQKQDVPLVSDSEALCPKRRTLKIPSRDLITSFRDRRPEKSCLLCLQQCSS